MVRCLDIPSHYKPPADMLWHMKEVNRWHIVHTEMSYKCTGTHLDGINCRVCDSQRPQLHLLLSFISSLLHPSLNPSSPAATVLCPFSLLNMLHCSHSPPLPLLFDVVYSPTWSPPSSVFLLLPPREWAGATQNKPNSWHKYLGHKVWLKYDR